MPVYEINVTKGGRTFQVRMKAPTAEDVLKRARDKGYEPKGGRAVEVSDTSPKEFQAVAQMAEASEAFVAGTMSVDELRVICESLAKDRQSGPIVQSLAREQVNRIEAAKDVETLRQILRTEEAAAEEEAEQEDLEAKRLCELMRRGDPQGYAKDRTEIAPGSLKEPLGERYGVLCLGCASNLVWVDLDPLNQAPMRVQELCSFRDFERLRRRGFLRRHITLEATAGGVWDIRLDRRRLTEVHRLMMGSGLLMHMIREDLEPVQISWTSSVG